MNIGRLAASNLREVVNSYHTVAKELDHRNAELDNVLSETDEAISVEKERLSGHTGNDKLNIKVSIGIFADFEGEVDIVLIYGVYFFVRLHPISDIKESLVIQSATWTAGCNIRLDMKTRINLSP